MSRKNVYTAATIKIEPAPKATPMPTSQTPPVSINRTLDQHRATFALAKVKGAEQELLRKLMSANKKLDEEELKKKAKSQASEYRAYARSLPFKILSNGLGQALAMELAASTKKEGHGLLLEHVTAWLTATGGWGSSPYHEKVAENKYRSTDLIQLIIDGSAQDLVRAQFETMAYLKWLKKFAEALIESSAEGGDDT
jgi:CRISPR-associated protein Cmr5